MIFIAHRGNLNGPNKINENKPVYLKNALDKGFNIEIDVWYINKKWILGHDKPDYEINLNFLENDKIWVHCKNLEALNILSKNKKINCFWHQTDEYTLTSKKYIWCYPGKKLIKDVICVMPEWNKDNNIDDLKKCYGICTDYVYKYMDLLKI